MRLLVLVPAAFGGRGGIAKFNRDFLTALAASPGVREVVALARQLDDPPGDIPPGVIQLAPGGGKLAYMAKALKTRMGGRFDAIVCGHVNLLPLARLLRGGATLDLIIHGIEAWQPPGGVLRRRGIAGVDRVITVSDVTRRRFGRWSGLSPERFVLIPNCVEPGLYRPGPPPADLLARYGLEGARVIMGMGRLDARERLKGFDEMLAAMPTVLARVPNARYLICGDGSDRPRLERRARELGVVEAVRFSGYVPEGRKADHFLLADCFVLAGFGEGFGIVILEALASGVPVVASRLDGSIEAIGGGAMGIAVDPRDREQLGMAVVAALSGGRGEPPAALSAFSFQSFSERVATYVEGLRARREGLT